jgi:hypothetical protein
MKGFHKKLVKKNRRSRAAKPATSSTRLAELAEVQEILLPELAARIAALEHVLIEKRICTRDELKQARVFIDTRRAFSDVGDSVAYVKGLRKKSKAQSDKAFLKEIDKWQR